MTFLRHFTAGFSAFCLVAGLAGAAEAEPVSFQPDSPRQPAVFTGTLKVDKIGSLALTNGLVVLRGNVISVVSSPDTNAPGRPVLDGFVLRVEADTEGTPAQVTGLAYFNSGLSFSEIDDPRTPDLVFKRDGALAGRLTGVRGYDLLVTKMNGESVDVDISTVKFVRSPRAFLFRIPLESRTVIPNAVAFRSNATTVNFKPTGAQRSLPLSSILPARPAQTADRTSDDGKLSRCGEGGSIAEEQLPKEEYDDEPLMPTFKWGLPGQMPFKQMLPFGQGGAGGF